MKKRYPYVIAISIFTVLLVFGAIFDLDVACAVFKQNDPWGIWMSAFAPFFSYSFLTFVSGYLFRFAITYAKKNEKFLMIVLAFLLFGVVTFFTQDKIISINAYNYPNLRWIAVVTAFVVNFGIAYLGFRAGKDKEDRKLLFATMILIIGGLVALVPLNTVLKSVFHRPRFRSLYAGNFQQSLDTFLEFFQRNKNYSSLNSQYTYLGNTFKEEFKSFPSGHTCEAAFTILALPYLSYFYKKLENKQELLFFIGLAFTLVMGFSRMRVGAHFLSDISFGALEMTICLIIANEINLKFFLNKTE